MKCKIRKNGTRSVQLCLLSLFLIILSENIEQVIASQLRAVSSTNLYSNALNYQLLQNQNTGIIDRAIAKIQKKEEQEQKAKEEQFMKQQQNLIKATRMAIQLAPPSNDDFDTVQQVMSNMRMGAALPQKNPESYDEKIEKIAAQQDEYKDEYEGFGSLTEMIKNQDKLAAKEVDEDSKKAEQIKAAKSKMTQALNNATKIQNAPNTNSLNKNKGGQAEQQQGVLQQKMKQASLSQNTRSTVKAPNQLSVINNSSSTNKNEKTQAQPTNDTNNNDSATLVIDEVVNEQDAASINALQIDSQSSDQTQISTTDSENDKQFQGFIGKYTSKFTNLEDKKQDDNPGNERINLMTDEEQTKKPRKGMAARFQDQVNQDEADSQQAQEIIQEYQHAETKLENRSVLDRETERLVQEQNDELELESEVEGDVKIE